MRTARNRSTSDDHGSVSTELARGVVGLAWHIVRLPILAFLIILEPAIRLLLAGAAFLGTFTAFLFKFSGVVPDFPFWPVISISIGCMLLLITYHRLILHLS